MKKHWMSGVIVACGVMFMANGAWAGKADIEKKAQNAIFATISLKNVTIEKALDTISDKAGIVIKKVVIPKDTPPVTLEAKYISALDVLKVVTEIANLTFAITDEGIEVSTKTDEAVKKQDASVFSVKP